MPPLPHQHVPRIITYYQTHHDGEGKHISVLPLLQQAGVKLTHLMLAAIHLNEDPAALTLNDHHPSHPRFTTLWAELRVLQAAGIKVLGMLGGAAKGSYERLDGDAATFERYYSPLADVVRERALDGLDLDVEEPMSLAGIIRLIDRLRADFGPGFVITLAPVAAALLNAQHNLSGFDYEALEVMRGHEIAFYNAQFYCGWGDCSNPAMYETLLLRGWRPDKIVVGLVTNPENGSGYVPWSALSTVIPLLAGRHPRFGGVMGWEYFNSLPGGRAKPWEWAQAMTALLRGQRVTSESAGGNGPAAGAYDDTKRHTASDKATLQREADADDRGNADGIPATTVPREFEYYSDGVGED
ncbi:glycoside hydrolase family 18 protein [Lasiosphaeria miniovina]|uniref:Glycoside hydrolase family 18 protein n=1 Tax=Lasiosphaeria miniovina TaxID=1954250 RepID=A0AA40B6F4_9PEZI|nr:glycoside hydrolase family 18 protein [Lasiosphaeria miniovina]KAK0728168.1 glycoside hydrolase family 18 protein [Lasiosphaeria miniovina]